MNRLLQICCLFVISLAYTNQAGGQCTNPSIPLPDASTPVNGNPATAYCVTLTFNPAQTGYPTGVSMLLQHTFQGDLDVFINACGNTLNVMQRPGAIGNCAGGSPFGNSNDIGSPGNPSLVTFTDGGGPDPENGIALGGGTYGITSDDACGVGTPGINSFASLWAACPPGNISAQICIGDHALLDSGVAQNITLNFPSPIICGCTNPLAPNYNPNANVDDGSCLPCVITVTATPTQPSCALNNGSISISPSGAGYTYAWSPGSVSGANPTNLAPGTYSVTVTQTSTGCTGTASVTLNSSTTLTVSANATQPTCGQNNGSISVTPSGAGYTYSWNPGSVSGSNPTNLAPGTYSVTVTQTAGGCTGTASVTLNPSLPILASATPTQPTCGQNNGSISVNPSGPGYSYTWNPPSVSGSNPTNLPPGTYSVTVTQAVSGCTATASATLNPSPVLNVTMTPTQPSCGLNNGAISVSPAGAGYTYTWNPGSLSGSSATNLGPGFYSVTVTETASGCMANASVTLNPSSPLVATATPTQPTCAYSNGSISVTPAGPGYTYAWNPPIVGGANPISLAPGSYTVAVTETATGCMDDVSVTLNPSSPLTVSLNVAQTSCGQNNGGIIVSPAGAGYTYAWNPPSFSGPSALNLAPGTYSVTVTQLDGGCTDEASATINPSSPPIANITASPSTICVGQSSTLTATGGGTYTWSTGQTGASITVSPTSTSNYSVTVSNGGCAATANITVNVNTVTASATASPATICVGDASTLTATGGGTYAWSTGQSGATVTVNPAATTTYTVTVTNNGCTDEASVTVNINTVTATATANPSVSCSGDPVQLTAGGGGTYAWSTGQSGATITVNPTATTTYSVTVTNNGCTDVANVTVTINTVTASATASPSVACSGDPVQLTATGGGTYAWNTGQSGATITVNPTATTTYTVTVTNNGCTDVANVTVTVNVVNASAVANPNPICEGQFATLTASGGGTYAWSTGETGASIIVTPTATTAYTVTVTNNGCTDDAVVNVVVNTVTANITAGANPICLGSSTNLVASGGGTYAWSTGQTGSTISISPAATTTYTVTVTSNGCTDVASLTVTVNSATATASAAPSVICEGGSSVLTATGGGTYAWSTGQTGASITVSPSTSTTYSVTVTNNGCTDVANVTVNVTVVNGQATASPAAICDGATSTLTATGGGTYAWSTGQSGASITVAPTGTTTYSVTVTNNGCTDVANVTVTVNSVTATATANPSTVCSGQVSMLTATGGGTYLWSTGQTGATVPVVVGTTTTFSVTVTNNGCTDVATVTVNVNSVTATATASPSTVCSGVASMLTATGGGTYAWSTGQSGATITVNPTATTTYTVTVTNGGCSGVANVTVNVNTVTAQASASPTAVCEGETSTLTATGGGSYAWSTGQIGASITVAPTATTTYTVTVTNNGCTDEADVTVTVNTVTATATANPATLCAGNPVQLTATGGGTYQWSSGQTTATFSVAIGTNTTFSVTVTDSNGCTDVASVMVNVISTVASVSASPSTVCPGLSSVLTATGGGTYQWSTGETGASITVTPAATTTYSVTVTNNSCVDVEQVTVTVGAILTPTVTASPSTVCPGQSSVLTASGGDTYSWSTGQSGASITVAPTTTTTYSVTATNNGCTGTGTVTVTVDPSLTATATAGPQTVCVGQASTLTATGGGTYAWSTGQMGSPVSVSPTTTTTYTVTVTNNGCTGTADVTVNVTPPPSATAAANPSTICAGQASTLTATGGGTYLWSDGQIGASVTVMPSSTTTYTVTVTNNGCTATATVTVNVNPLPTPTASADPATICAGQSSTLTAAGGGTYQWSSGQNGATITVSPTSTTSYTVTVTNNGCSATANVTVNVNPLPTPTATASPATICAGQTSTLTATGGGTYAWSSGQTGATINVSPTATTTYTVTVTNNGCTATTDVTVTVNPLPMPAATAEPPNICAGQASTLTATGGGTYQWNGGQFGSPIQVSPASTTTYTVTVTNNGCTGTADVTVTVNSATASASAIPATICPGLTSTLTATGGGTYAWNTGQSSASISVNPIATTTYSVTVTNNGCTDEAMVTVNVENNLSATATASPAAICAGQSSTLTATGGGTYAWSSGQSGATITVSPVATTTYTVTVTNNGCTGTASVTVTVNPLPTAIATASPTSICLGQTSTLTATGGGTYQWSTGQSGPAILVTPLSTTTYQVTATNNGCTGTGSVTVTVNPLPNPTATANPASICAGQTSTLTATGGGTYQWNTGQSGATLTVTPQFTTAYQVTVTANGCSATADVTVTVNPLPTPTATASPAAICAGQTSVLTATGGGTYQWSSGQSGATIAVSPATTTTYTVTVTNNGCTGTASVTVVVTPLPTPTATANPAVLCAGQSTTLTASGGGAYLWSTGQSGANITVTPAATTNFSVTATNNGCSGVAQVTVTVNTTTATATAALSTVCPGLSTTLTATGGGTYAWSTGQSGATITVTPAATTTYTVTVTNNGCTDVVSVTVAVSNVLVPTIEAAPASICTGQNTVLTAFGGDTFMWSTGQTDPSITVMPLATTTYSVEVGLNGCTGSSSITVVVNPLPVPAASADPATICEGESTTLTATGGDTFLWSTGESGSSISVTPAATTTYSVTATSNGCTATADVTVVVNPLPVAAASAAPDSICAGQSSTLTATGGSIYMWSTGQSGSSITVTPASTTVYTVTVTGNGCSSLANTTVVVNPLPVPTATANPNTVCIGQSTTLTAGGGDTYIWSDGQPGDSVEVTPTTTTTYAVTVTNIYGCQASTSTTVTVNPLPTATASPETICLGQSAVLSAGGGTTYSWSTGQTGATITVSPTTTTAYAVTVTANGCTDTTDVTVTVNEVNASVSASATTICPGLPVVLTASGGSTYSWNTGQAGETITVNPVVNTTYSVTVSNQGCTGLASVTVMMGDTLTPTIIATPDTLCVGQAGTLTAEGGGTYQWNSGQTSASINVAPTSTTTYVVTVTNSGCVGAAQATIVVNPLPLSDIQTSAPVICDGESATLTASGGSTYLWSTGDTDAVISVSPSQTTLYSVTVTENGCSATASTTLTVNPIPVALAQPDTICVGQSAALSASGGDVYQWSTGQSGASITVSPVVTTTYSVTVIDEGCTSVIPVTVTVNPLPVPIAVASPPVICLGQSTTLTVSGGATFVWSTGQSGAAITVTPGSSATYGITATENGCVGTTQIGVTVNSPPSAVVTLNADVCNGPGGPATLDFSALVIGGDMGGVWTDLQNSGATGTFPTLDFTGVTEGSYLFRYTTQSATAPCQEAIYDVTVQVVFCDCPSVATSAAGPLCNTGGSLNLTTLQQTSEPGTWSIVAAPAGSNPASITNNIFNAANADAGQYEIRFTLVNTPPAGCPAFSTQFIQVDDAVFAGQPEPVLHFCVGSNEVVHLFDLLQGEDLGGQWTEISAVPSTSGAFQPAAGSFAISAQLPATYSFRYLLNTGGVCPTSEAIVSVVVEPSPVANAGADMALDCIITSVTLNGANSSSGPHISYLWSTTDGNITSGINTATPAANTAGVYLLTVTNITYGCSATDEVTVTADNIPPQNAVVSVQNPRCHNETNGAVSVISVSGGSGPFLYSFNNQPFVASPNFSSLGAGIYPLIVEDANGCRWETSLELENPPAISVDAGPNVTIFYGDSTRLDAEITPASGNYVIKWTPSDSLSCTSCPQPLATPDSTVTYHVLITDENGCTATDEVTVFIKFKPDVYIPNSFSPNGDNINDIFMIYAGDRIDKILELEIYSRWGESVFYVANFLPNDPQYGWNGMFRGKPAVLDVYAYFAIVLYKNGTQKLFKGDVQVTK